MKTMTCEYVVTVSPKAGDSKSVFRFPVRIPVTGDVVRDHAHAATAGQLALPWIKLYDLPVTQTARVPFSIAWV